MKKPQFGRHFYYKRHLFVSVDSGAVANAPEVTHILMISQTNHRCRNDLIGIYFLYLTFQ